MTTSIKITQLNSIGANISHTTLSPVVDMVGTPETKKASLQQIGNLILSSAGGSEFAPANIAIIAQSVSNAAQPNITSVGTLTSLEVSGNVTGNLVSANFFSVNESIFAPILIMSPDTVVALPNPEDAGAGARAFVNDATTTDFASEVVGGGTNTVPVYSNGTAWLIG